MSTFNIEYTINGNTYPVLNDNTIGVAYDLSASTLSVIIMVNGSSSVNALLIEISDPDTVMSFSIQTLNESQAVVDTIQGNITEVISRVSSYASNAFGSRINLTFTIADVAL